MKEELLQLRNQLKMGHRISFAEAMLLQRAIDILVNKAGNSPAQSDCCQAQNCIHSAQGVDSPVAWHHSAKSKEGNHGTCCFSYASSHDFGPGYEKPQSQPHYLPERLDYDRALHFLSTEPRKVTPETVIGGNSPAIPDGYVMAPKEATLEMIKSGASAASNGMLIPGIYKAMLAAADCSIPMISDRWIPVSEQMPEVGDIVLTAMGGVVNVGEMECSAANCRFFTSVISGRELPATHWMPLPAGPQEVK